MPGDYTVTLTAIDTKSNAKTEASFKLTITPLAPKVSIKQPAPLADGQSVSLGADIVYAGLKGQNEKVSWQVISPTGETRALTGREPAFVPDQSGTWARSSRSMMVTAILYSRVHSS